MRLKVNGISLNVELAGEGPPLMLLHGFTGCADGWRPMIERWPHFRTIAVDIIGHGNSDSPPDPSRYTMQACADDLAVVLDTLGIEKTALLGYSMGGRVALHFALRHQERLMALVLESASPGLSDPAERAARIRSDEGLAARIEREGIEAFVDYWESLPLWGSQRGLPPEKRQALRAQRLRNSTTGLANSLRGMGAGAQEPVFGRLHQLRIPTLFLAGAPDTRYVDLASTMATEVEGAALRVVPGAGHAAHFEQPDAFSEAAAEFLTRCLRSERVEA